jgi:hypothetical protein
MPVVIVPKYAKVGEGFTRRERAASLEHPGRRTDGSQSAAHWVTWLTDLKKIVILCSFCRSKFNPRKHGYRRMYAADLTGRTDGYVANGKCDACNQMTVDAGGGTAYITEETYAQVNADPVEVRRQARLRSAAAWKG